MLTEMASHKPGDIDLSIVLSTPIQDCIQPDIVKYLLSQPPFLPIPGALNIRDISVLPNIRKGFIHRSGALGHITPAGESFLAKAFGIRTVFDLRSLAERDSRPSPEIEGIETRWVPSVTDAKVLMLKREDPKDYIEEDGKRGHLMMYSNILESYKDAFKEILVFLRDEKESGILFHCTGTFAHRPQQREKGR